MLKLVAVSAALIATAAVAQTPSSPPADNSSNSQTEDPNEVVCRYQPVIGSRVNRTRVCRTRAEWANARDVTKGAPRSRRDSGD